MKRMTINSTNNRSKFVLTKKKRKSYNLLKQENKAKFENKASIIIHDKL